MIDRFERRPRSGKRFRLVLKFCFVATAFNVLLYGVHHLLLSPAWPVESYFMSPLSPTDKSLLDDTFRVLHDALMASDVTVMLTGGSLLGSYRHHGRVPWDDDIDVMLNSSVKSRVKDILSRLQPNYILVSRDDDYQWKFFSSKGRQLIHQPHRTPFIDLFFYGENSTHIWNECPYFTADERWSKSVVFPLIARPFGNLMVPCPCDPEAVLSKNFNLSLCRTRDHNHILDIKVVLPKISVQCLDLYHVLPFVYRVPTPRMNISTAEQDTARQQQRTARTVIEDLVTEELKMGRWTLQRFALKSGC